MRNSDRDREARARAQALWDETKSQNQRALDEREKQHQAAVSKIMRLRELRLAKEAADRKAAEQRFLRQRRKLGA
jgi:hypothetical protein